MKPLYTVGQVAYWSGYWAVKIHEVKPIRDSNPEEITAYVYGVERVNRRTHRPLKPRKYVTRFFGLDEFLLTVDRDEDHR